MEPGSRIGDRFTLGVQVGKGGMGAVYRARDEVTGAPVAIKIVSSGAERFDREADLLARLVHPAIVRHIAHGRTESGEQFLVMQWLDGEDLQQHLARQKLSPAQTIELLRVLTAGLAEVHAQGIVHRDLKPSNIWLVERRIDRPVLLDFGIARPLASWRLTMTGHVVGTPQYMAPEQIQTPTDVDARADVYALGAVAFECLAGRPPFVGENAIAVLAKVLIEEAPALRDLARDTPEALASVIQRALSKRREDRPADSRELLANLEAMEAGEAIAASSPAAPSIGTTERRLVCVVLAENAGIADVTATPLELSAELGRIRDLANGHSMQLVPLAGGYVATARSTGIATDHARRTARYALALAAQLPAAGVALAMGWGTVEPVPVGEAIDRAAALLHAGRAPGTGVRIDDVTAGLLEVACEITRDHAGYILLGERRTGERPRTLLGRATTCVGRDRELRALEDLFAEVRDDGVARAVLVTAPAGGGKSRIRHELLSRLAQSAEPPTIAIAQAEMLRAGSPLDLLGQIIRALVGIDASATGDAPRAAIRDHVRARIPAASAGLAEFLFEIVGLPVANGSCAPVDAARADARTLGDQMLHAWISLIDAHCTAGPCVLVLEDLHWGDAQTVRFIDAALRDLPNAPLFVLALARAEVHDRFPGVWRDRPLHEIRIGALPPRACVRLIREVLPELHDSAVERIIQHSEGNAFFLEEMIRASSATGSAVAPTSVVAMVQARLEALDTTTRRVVRAASVFGEACQTAGLAAVLGGNAETTVEPALERLVAAEVMTRRATGYAFRHALVREAAYAALTEDDRRVAHGLAARWLESMHERDALLLAGHYAAAGERADAARCWADAAHQALEKNDFDAALARARSALELEPGPDMPGSIRAGTDTRRSALIAQGRTYVCLGRWAEAQQHVEAALAMTDDPEARIEMLRDLVRVGTFRQDIVLLRRTGDEALAIATRLGRPELIAEASAALAMADHGDGRCDEAATRYLASCESSGRSTVVHGLAGIILYHTARFAECLRWNEKHLRQATDARDWQGMTVSLANVGLAHTGRGEYALAEEHFTKSCETAERAGLTTMLARSISISAGWQIDLFDFDSAAQTSDRARNIGRELEFSTPRISAILDLATIAVRQDRPSDAESLLESIANVVATGGGFHGWLWRLKDAVARAELAAARRDYPQAIARSRAAAELCDRYRRTKYAVVARTVLARALAATDQRDDTGAILATARADAERCGDPSLRLRVQLAALACGSRDALGSATELAADIERALPAARAARFRASRELIILG